MKKCSFCGRKITIEDAEKYQCCLVCGSPLIDLDEQEVYNKEKFTSIFVKYSNYVNDDVLFNVACAKESGSMKENVPGEATEIFRILAFKGHLESMYKYACACINDNPPDKVTAMRWLTIAAGQGHVPSKVMLIQLKAVPGGVTGGTKETNVKNTQAVDPNLFLNSDSQNNDLQVLMAAALPSVMCIYSTHKANGHTVQSAGSGFIIDGDYIITNAHVISSNPLSVVAKFDPSISNDEFLLTPLVIDPSRDLAVLKFTGSIPQTVEEAQHFPLRIGDVNYGEKIFTIGNPLALGISVSHGIVSNPKRQTDYPINVEHVIQSDMSINHGNSGGVLLDFENRVIGVATFIPSDAIGGIGMFVPTKYIIEVINQIK